MRATVLLATGVSLLLVCAAGAQAPAPQTKQAADQPIFIPASDLKWTDLDPKGAPGVQVATMWGDHTKGAFGAFFRLPAGFSAPLHTHTHEMRVVFISGTYLQRPEGEAEARLGPGSYMLQPGGNYRHVTTCDKAADCVFFVQSDGAFDLTVVQTDKR
jgi:anti-sigma factor ChrR (cupin superfamily)